MIWKTSLFVVLVLLSDAVFGQKCEHKNLSEQFDFTTELLRIPRETEFDSCIVTIRVLDKIRASEQKITITSNYFFEPVFADSSQVRSYISGFRKDVEDVDNDYGDLIVADFNFDGKDDLALKNDSGGNAGPTYDFYVQDDSGKLVKDVFLTEKSAFFPTLIDAKKKRLTTFSRANISQLRKAVFQYNAKTKKWKVKKRSLVSIFDLENE